MKSTPFHFCFVMLLWSIPWVASAASGAYIANIAGTGLTILNLSTNAIQSVIYVGNSPWGMTRKDSEMWVTNSDDDTISIINVTNNTVTRTISGAGDRPTTIAFSGTGAYVVNENGGTVTIVDTSNYQVERTITVGATPIGIAISGTGAYVANSGSSDVSVIDIANNQVERTISVNSFPWFVVISNTGAYVSNSNDDTVTIIDTTNGAVERTISVGSTPRGMTLAGTGLYVANLTTDNVSVIDLRRNVVAVTISVGDAPIGIGSTGTGVYVSNYNAGTLSVIDSTNNAVERTITIGGTPHFLGFLPNLNTSPASSSSSSQSGGGGVATFVQNLRLQNGLDKWGYPISSSSSASSNSSSSASSQSSVSSVSSSSSSASSSSSLGQNISSASSSPQTEHIRITAQDGIIFRDVWADDWFGPYVKKLLDLKIFEGYKDAEGRPLGLYGPSDAITIGQLAKIGDLLGNHPVTPVAGNEWASPYIETARKAGLSLFTAPINGTSLATRGEVVQTVLEALNIPMTEAVDLSLYSDVSATSSFARAIATATEKGIVSGDDRKDTFRPNDPIKRAEVAKIVVLALQISK